MGLFQIAVAVLLTSSLGSAQDLNTLSEIPQCAQDPAKSAFIASGCALNDAKCICTSKDFQTQLTNAALTDCNQSDQLAILKFAEDFCAAAHVSLSIPQTTAANAFLSSSSVAANAPPPSSAPPPPPSSQAPSPSPEQASSTPPSSTSTSSFFIAPAFKGLIAAPSVAPVNSANSSSSTPSSASAGSTSSASGGTATPPPATATAAGSDSQSLYAQSHIALCAGLVIASGFIFQNLLP